MKRLAALLMSILCFYGIVNAAKGKCGDNLTWTLDKNGVLTITGTGEMNNYNKSNIPWRTDLIKELSLGDGITRIGNNAFSGAKIYNVTVPSTVTSIGDNAFKNCKQLVGVTLTQGLIKIGEGAFRDCRALVKIQIPSSVRSIGKRAFAGCSLLSSISLPDRLDALGEEAFQGCYGIAHIASLPEYINKTNCRLYGLPDDAVANYLNNHQANMATVNISDYKPNPTTNNIPDNSSSKEIKQIKYGDSDIDKNIPLKTVNNSHTFAFIFANEKYEGMPDVPFAINDGKSFATYCHSTLGIPESNINTYYNATYGKMRAAVEYLKQLDETFKGDLNVIIYYAGHGAPDEKTNVAYLVPTDAYAVNSSVCYPLDDLYSDLGNLKARNVKVFMDACFSGTDRSNDMLAQGGRLVATVPKKSHVSGNVVVVSATSNDQTAWYHKEQGHGLFTYCLIKKLQQTGGEVSMGELCEYLQEQIPQISIVQNRVLQNPTFQSSPTLGNSWRLWTLK